MAPSQDSSDHQDCETYLVLGIPIISSFATVAGRGSHPNNKLMILQSKLIQKAVTTLTTLRVFQFQEKLYYNMISSPSN